MTVKIELTRRQALRLASTLEDIMDAWPQFLPELETATDAIYDGLSNRIWEEEGEKEARRALLAGDPPKVNDPRPKAERHSEAEKAVARAVAVTEGLDPGDFITDMAGNILAKG